MNYTRAGRLFEVKIGYFNTVFPNEPMQLKEDASAFVRRWHDSFVKKGNVQDDPRGGRPPKIPDDKAREAAEIIARGYTVERTVRRQVIQEHKYFSSVAEAISHEPKLQELMRDYKVDATQLLNAIHRVAPELEHRRVTFRHQLSQDEMEKRAGVSAGLLLRYRADHTLLQSMVFIDETTIMTHGLKHDHIEVWVNKTDKRFHDYHGVPGKSWDPVKVHVVAAVTAHPQYENSGGLMYVDFTTGTTDIRRRVNKRMDGSTAVTNFVYLVSGLLLM